MSSSSTMSRSASSVAWRAIVLGGSVAGLLDAADGVVAYFLAFRMNPIQVLQYIASGLLGASAFGGGLGTALVGLLVHFAIAFAWAAVFWVLSDRWPALRARAIPSGLLFGALVYLVMNLLVLPYLSRVASGPPSMPLVVNGLIGHALFVGLPIAVASRRTAFDGPAAGPDAPRVPRSA